MPSEKLQELGKKVHGQIYQIHLPPNLRPWAVDCAMFWVDLGRLNGRMKSMKIFKNPKNDENVYVYSEIRTSPNPNKLGGRSSEFEGLVLHDYLTDFKKFGHFYYVRVESSRSRIRCSQEIPKYIRFISGKNVPGL